MLAVPALALLFALNKLTPSDILWVLKFFSKIMFGLCLNTSGSLPGSPGGLLAGSGQLGGLWTLALPTGWTATAHLP